MSNRSLNGLSGFNTNSVVITNRMEMILPLEQTQADFTAPILLGLKGITGFTGNGGNVLKSNTANNALEWGVDNNEIISVDLPLLKTGSTISLTGLNTLSITDANKVLKVNAGGTAIEYATDNNENITVSLPLDRTGDLISLTGLNTLSITDANKVLKVNAGGTAIEYATDNNENITVSLPLDRTGDLISLTGLNTLSITDANKIIRVNAGGTALEYATDAGSNWTLSNNNLYPLSTGTNVVVGSTINSSTTRKLFVNGTADINGELFFNGDDETYIDADSKSLRNYAGYVAGSIGGQHKFYVKQSSSTDLVSSLRTGALTIYGESNMNSGLSKLELIASGSQQFRIINNNGGGSTPNISFESETVGATIDPYYYSFTFDTSERYRFTKNDGISIGEWKATAIGAAYGGTGQTTYAIGDILYCSATNVLQKLSIGLEDQVLTVSSSGIPNWEDTASPDLTTSNNFGTAVLGTNTIKLGNSAGTNQTVELELYFSSTLKLNNTGGGHIATFTNSLGGMDIDLKGGTITTATMGTNALWNGTAIGITYGGTGLSSLTANKILQVNSGGTGFNQVSLPVVNTYTGTGDINVNSATNVISFTGTIPSAVWSLNGTIISPASSSNFTIQVPGSSSSVIGNITNPANNSYPLIRYGAFQTAYTTDIQVSNLYIQNFTGASYRQVILSCNSAFDRLEINKNTKITGGLDATTSISCDKFSALNTTSNYFESNSSYGFGLYGITSGRQLSIRGKNSNFPYLGSTSTENFVIHIENFGDAYEISTPSTGSQSDITHHLYGNTTFNGDLILDNPATGSQSNMRKIRFNSENEDCFMSEQFRSNAPSGDMVWKIKGGDIRMFRDNTINSDAGNYQALFFLYGAANDNIFYIFAGGTGGSSSNIFLSGSTFDGNRSYSGGSSDDRLKFEEELITNATDTLMKLRPQIYMKDDKLPQRRNRKDPNIIEDNEDIIRQKEAGLIAQEVYYECPELRHLVLTRVENEEDIQELPEGTDLTDIQNDPDYVSLGWDKYVPANVKYIELIPYLIKSNQEQQLEIDTLKTELTGVKEMLNKLVNAKSFADFKKTIA